MERKKSAPRPAKPAVQAGLPAEYDLETPLFNKYYKQVRKTIKFPRYYKHELNW